jgi:molecular chaperone IbpA
MRTYDFSPLWRSTIGFNRLFDLAESAQRATEDNCPPYNIERLGEDSYQISLAVAGFSPDEILNHRRAEYRDDRGQQAR